MAATKELQSMSPFRPAAGGAGASSAAPSPQSPNATQAYGQPVYSANSNGSASNGAHGQSAAASASAYPAATSAYGQPAYPGKGQSVASPASAYGSSGAAGSAYASAYPSAYGQQQSASATSSPLSRTNYGMPALSAWQPSTLPVSPWSTISPGGVAPLGGGVDTTTILRSDLKALKRSRLKGWGYLFLSIGIFAGLGYFGVKQHIQLKARADKATLDLNNAKKNYEATLTKLGVSESQAAAATSNTPGAVVAVPAVASAASTKLADDLKKALTGVAGWTVESRGDRVVVAMDQASVFEDSTVEISLAGYKSLLKFGKALKLIKDRRIVVTVPGDAKKGKAWNLAIGRSLVLGRYVVDDLNLEPHRVTSAAPGGPQGRGGRNIEFSLEPMPETTKS